MRGGFDFGIALPLRALVGLAADRRRRGQRFEECDGGQFLLRRIRQQLRRRQVGQALSQVRFVPGVRDQRDRGLNFVNELVEWNLPPYVFESAGTPRFYVNWLRPSVFVAGLWRDPAIRLLRKDYASAGAQMDLRFSVLHWYEMTLSVGYAVGYQGSRRAGDEWMISLKIM